MLIHSRMSYVLTAKLLKAPLQLGYLCFPHPEWGKGKECWFCFGVLQMARNLGIQHLTVKGDSKLIIMQMQEKWKINFPHLRILQSEAVDIMKGFEKITLGHVRR